MICLPWALACLAAAQGQEVSVTIEPAVELRIATREGFRYDIEESETMSNFQPNGASVEGTGETESLFFPVDGKRFFRAAEIPTDIRKLIPGLEIYSLNTAMVSSDNGEIAITGARVTSRDYDQADFATIRYSFDFPSQSFLPMGFEVIEGAGPTMLRNEAFYPLNDPAQTGTVSYLGNNIAEGGAVSLNIPAGGAAVIFDGKARQILNYQFSGSKAYEITVLDGADTEVGRFIYSGFSLHENAFTLLEDTVRKLRFRALDGNASSVNFAHANGNRFGTTMKSPGDSVSTGSMIFHRDYQRYRITLEKDRRLRISGSYTNGGTFVLCKANGEQVDTTTFSSGGSLTSVLAPVPETAEYTLVFLGEPFETNRFVGTLTYFVE